MAAETHRATISTTNALKEPSSNARSDRVEPPMLQRIWSISSSIRGSSPPTHNTIISQATQEMVRSTTRTPRLSPKAA